MRRAWPAQAKGAIGPARTFWGGPGGLARLGRLPKREVARIALVRRAKVGLAVAGRRGLDCVRRQLAVRVPFFPAQFISTPMSLIPLKLVYEADGLETIPPFHSYFKQAQTVCTMKYQSCNTVISSLPVTLWSPGA